MVQLQKPQRLLLRLLLPYKRGDALTQERGKNKNALVVDL